LKSLLAQFGTKAKVADEIDNDAKKLRSNIEALMAKAQAAQVAQARVNKVCHMFIKIIFFFLMI
jgi:hypothetical protein